MAQSSPERFRSRHQFQNAFGLAMDSIRAHKLRSFLTLLGVIIGVASVILVGAAIAGLGVYAEAEHRQGVRLGIVHGGADRGHRPPEPPRVFRQDQAQQADPPRRLRAFWKPFNGDEVLYSPYRNHTSDVKRENLICEDTTIIGVSADMAEIRDIGVVEGRFFTEQEDRSRALRGGDRRHRALDTLFPGEASRARRHRAHRGPGIHRGRGRRRSWGRPSGATRISPSTSR